MKLILPKRLQIGTTVFEMEYDETEDGGYFNFQNRRIGIGTRVLKDNPEAVFGVIVHELSEAIHVILHSRYDGHNHQRHYRFVQDHEQFTTHCELLARALQNFVK